MDDFFQACEKGRYEVVKNYLENGDNVSSINYASVENRYGRTGMYFACKNDNLSVFGLLYKKGADINKKFSNGKSYLHVACWYGSFKIVKFLLNHIDVDVKDNSGFTPLFYASCRNGLGMNMLLLENGADIHMKNNSGFNCLHLACARGNYDVVKFLVENGANFQGKDKYGLSPLSIAIKNFDLIKENEIDNVGSMEEYQQTIDFLRNHMKKNAYILSLIVQNDVLKHHILRKMTK